MCKRNQQQEQGSVGKDVTTVYMESSWHRGAKGVDLVPGSDG